MKCGLFDKLVLPVLMYGCEVCVLYPAKAIEQAHTDFYKTVLRVKRTAMNEMIYCRSGNFRVFNFSRISDFGTFHEVQNSRIFIFL